MTTSMLAMNVGDKFYMLTIDLRCCRPIFVDIENVTIIIMIVPPIGYLGDILTVAIRFGWASIGSEKNFTEKIFDQL